MTFSQRMLIFAFTLLAPLLLNPSSRFEMYWRIFER